MLTECVRWQREHAQRDKGCSHCEVQKNCCLHLSRDGMSSENQSDWLAVPQQGWGGDRAHNQIYLALAIEHEAKPPLKLSEGKDNSMVAGSVHVMRINSAALEWFTVFIFTQQLFSPESTDVLEKYCYREAALTNNCELRWIMNCELWIILRNPHFCTGCCLLLKVPGTLWGFLNRPSVSLCPKAEKMPHTIPKIFPWDA